MGARFALLSVGAGSAARISKNGTPVARPVRKATGLSEVSRFETAGLPNYAYRQRGSVRTTTSRRDSL